MFTVTFHHVLSVGLTLSYVARSLVEASNHCEKNEADETALLQTVLHAWPYQEDEHGPPASWPYQEDAQAPPPSAYVPQGSADYSQQLLPVDASAPSAFEQQSGSKQTSFTGQRDPVSMYTHVLPSGASTPSDSQQQATTDRGKLPQFVGESAPAASDQQISSDIGNLLQSLDSVESSLGTQKESTAEALPNQQSVADLSTQSTEQKGVKIEGQSISAKAGKASSASDGQTPTNMADELRLWIVGEGQQNKVVEPLPNQQSAAALPPSFAEQSQVKMEGQPISTETAAAASTSEVQIPTSIAQLLRFSSMKHVDAGSAQHDAATPPGPTTGDSQRESSRQSSISKEQAVSASPASFEENASILPKLHSSLNVETETGTVSNLLSSPSSFRSVQIQADVKSAQSLLAKQSEFSNALKRVGEQLHAVDVQEVTQASDDAALATSLEQGLQGVKASERAVDTQLEYEKRVSSYLTDAVKQAEDAQFIQQNVAKTEDQASRYLEQALKEAQASLAGDKTDVRVLQEALKNVLKAQSQVVAGEAQQKQAAFNLKAALIAASNAAMARQVLSQTQISPYLEDVEHKIQNLESMVLEHGAADTKATHVVKQAVKEAERAESAAEAVRLSWQDISNAQRHQERALNAAQEALMQKEKEVMHRTDQVTKKVKEATQQVNEMSRQASERWQAIEQQQRKAERKIAEDQQVAQQQAGQMLQQAADEKRQVDLALRQAAEEKQRAADMIRDGEIRAAEDRKSAEDTLRHAADTKRQAESMIEAAQRKQMQVQMQIENSVSGLSHASRQMAQAMQSWGGNANSQTPLFADPMSLAGSPSGMWSA